jgi:hypothetical protein
MVVAEHYQLGTARYIRGVPERQQNGYECSMLPLLTSLPLSCSFIVLFTFQIAIIRKIDT